MKLRCLGRVALTDSESTDSDFSRPVPLLLLGYLALTGKELRSEVAEMFWPSADKRKRHDNLSENLRKLRRVSENLVEDVDKQRVRVHVDTDVTRFRNAFDAGDFETAAHLYGGPLLAGIERNGHFKLGEELEEWLVNLREELQEKALETFLTLAEREARAGDFGAAAGSALRAFESKGVSYPTQQDYERTHLLLVAAGRSQDAAALQREAEDIYDDLALIGQQRRARARLTFTLNLPPVSSTFVGRQGELARLKEGLTRSRLVTVTGIGGVGKTELAVVFVCGAGGDFRDGLFFVSLETLPPNSSSEAFLLRVGAGLGLKQGASDPFESARAFLEDKQALLVVDNMEHLKEHAAVLARLLAACPDLRVLVTSRERLNLDEERLLELNSLPYKGDEHDGLDLFRRRAALVGYELDSEGVAAAARLVELVHGHPLAIKLAVSRLGATPLSELVKSLEHSLEPLADGPLDDAERHRSIRGAFDFSYRLLAAAEQEAFVNLAVFVGPFSPAAAAAVVAAPPHVLRGLVHTSFLRFDPVSGRYSLHPLLRHYARELWQDAESLQNAHARYFLEQLQHMTDAAQEIKNEAPKRLSNVAPDLFAAWTWAVEQGWQAQIGATALALMLFGNATSKMREVGGLLEGALETFASAEPSFRGRLSSNLAWCYLRGSEYVKTIATAQNSIAQLGDADDALSRSNSLLALANAESELGEFAASQATYRQALELHPEESVGWANVLMSLASVATHLGEYEQAAIHFEQTHKIFLREHKCSSLIALSALRGRFYCETGKLLKATITLEQALSKAERHNYQHHQLTIRTYLASAYLVLGDLERADECALKLQTLANEVENRWRESLSLLLLSRSAFARREFDNARHLLVMSFEASRYIMNIPGKLRQLIDYLHLENSSSFETRARLYNFLNHPRQLTRMRHVDRILFESSVKLSRQPLNHEENLRSYAELSVQEVIYFILDREKKEG